MLQTKANSAVWVVFVFIFLPCMWGLGSQKESHCQGWLHVRPTSNRISRGRPRGHPVGCKGAKLGGEKPVLKKRVWAPKGSPEFCGAFGVLQDSAGAARVGLLPL